MWAWLLGNVQTENSCDGWARDCHQVHGLDKPVFLQKQIQTVVTQADKSWESSVCLKQDFLGEFFCLLANITVLSAAFNCSFHIRGLSLGPGV